MHFFHPQQGRIVKKFECSISRMTYFIINTER